MTVNNYGFDSRVVSAGTSPKGAPNNTLTNFNSSIGAGRFQIVNTSKIKDESYVAIPTDSLDNTFKTPSLPPKGSGIDTSISGIPLDPSFYAEKPIVVNPVPETPARTTGASIAHPISADDVSETATRIWFTPDYYELLVKTYKLVSSGDLKIKQDKIVVWVIQQGSLSGQQELVVRTPFKGSIYQVSASCLRMLGDIDINIYKADKASFESGTPAWVLEPSLSTRLTTSSTSNFATIPAPILCNLDNYYTIEVVNPNQLVPIDTPITVEMVVSLSDS